jgi:ATP-dependent RNA helicase DeaD
MVRLAFNVGREHDVQPGDLVGVIAGVTRLPRENIGRIELEPKRALVDVSEEHAGRVLKKLNGIVFKGRKLAVQIPR